MLELKLDSNKFHPVSIPIPTYGSIDGSFGTSGSVSGSGVGIETG